MISSHRRKRLGSGLFRRSRGLPSRDLSRAPLDQGMNCALLGQGMSRGPSRAPLGRERIIRGSSPGRLDPGLSRGLLSRGPDLSLVAFERGPKPFNF